MSRYSHDAGPSRRKGSRSCSPGKKRQDFWRRSPSPESRKPPFRPSMASFTKRDKLSACPVCLGRHRHHVASCQVTKVWNGKDSISTRTDTGRILNKRGVVICSDWQRPNRCTDTAGKHLHECSGCVSAEHGADTATSWSPEVVTPLVASEWLRALQAANLLSRYPYIPPFILHGANAGIPSITATFTPPNHPSIALHEDTFLDIIENKFKKCRYWGHTPRLT